MKKMKKPTDELTRNPKHNKERNDRCDLTRQVVEGVNGNLQGSMESLISWFGKSADTSKKFVKVLSCTTSDNDNEV